MKEKCLGVEKNGWKPPGRARRALQEVHLPVLLGVSKRRHGLPDFLHAGKEAGQAEELGPQRERKQKARVATPLPRPRNTRKA